MPDVVREMAMLCAAPRLGLRVAQGAEGGRGWRGIVSVVVGGQVRLLSRGFASCMVDGWGDSVVGGENLTWLLCDSFFTCCFGLCVCGLAWEVRAWMCRQARKGVALLCSSRGNGREFLV